MMGGLWPHDDDSLFADRDDRRGRAVERMIDVAYFGLAMMGLGLIVGVSWLIDLLRGSR